MNNQNDTDIVITAMSGLSPLGLNLEQTCASIRADINRFTEHAYFECVGADPEWDEEEPLIASTVPSIDPFVDGPERLLQLIIPTLTEIFSVAKIKRKEVQSGGFFLALPHTDEIVMSWSLDQTFIPELFRRTGLNSYKIHKISHTGHTGMFCLIQDALTMLRAGEVELCIVGGVDSYLMEQRLEFLDNAWRIKSSKSVDGFIPGEAAIVLLLETLRNAKARERQSLATVSFCETGNEPNNISSDKCSSGTGLSDAIRKVLNQGEDKSNIRWVICDLNGESYRGFEWGVVQTRLHNYLSAIEVVSHPADCLGDIGAATGGMLIANAVQAFKRGYNISDDALLWTSSDDGLRAALCINL
jgi:3-oxoacyl-[acyl-carrier-protein] synthase-1